jgi:predicted phosphodiesterase
MLELSVPEFSADMTLRIAAISDTHLAPPGEPEASWHNRLAFETASVRLQRAMKLVGDVEADLVILLGDLTNHGDDATLDILLDHLAASPVPTFAVPGNHDAEQAAGALAEAVERARHRHVRMATPHWREVARTVSLAGSPLSATDTPGVFAVHPPVGDPSGELAIWLTHYPVYSRLDQFAAHGLRYPGDALQRDAVEMALSRGQRPVIVVSGHLHARAVLSAGTILEISASPSIEAPFEMTLLDLTISNCGEIDIEIDHLGLDPWGVRRAPVLSPRWQRWNWRSGWSVCEEGDS